MSKLLLNLYQVPDDEAADVRALLDSHAIGFYETRPNRWGISSGAIWVTDDAAIDEARRLMADYQDQRRARVQAEIETAQRDGSAQTLWTVFRNDPVRVLLTVCGILVILALVLVPFFWRWG
jgi:hypothetical protein